MSSAWRSVSACLGVWARSGRGMWTWLSLQRQLIELELNAFRNKGCCCSLGALPVNKRVVCRLCDRIIIYIHMEWFLDACSLGGQATAGQGKVPQPAQMLAPRLRSMASMELELDEGEPEMSQQMLYLEPQDMLGHRPDVDRQDFLDLLLVKHYPQQVKVFDTSKKPRSSTGNKITNLYRKNICGYITRRITREFLSDHFQHEVRSLCLTNKCQYDDVHAFYLCRIEQVTGPRHLPMLFRPESKAQVPVKRTFRTFFKWFLKERYVRYLISDGKMSNKRAYIEYKNTVLASFLQSQEDNEEPSSQRDCN